MWVRGAFGLACGRVPLYFDFGFLPGLIPARIFRAFSMSRSDQSRILTVPTSTKGGASIVPAATCLWIVSRVRPNFLAAWRVEYFPFTI